jgi:hypothetical protein
MKALARGMLAIALTVIPAPIYAQPTAAATARNPFDVPEPPRKPPFRWPNEHGQEIECGVSPWQRIDLGTIGPARIYAGDHCSNPIPDPVTEVYKRVFSYSCDLHDICYLAPGNSKRFCDDMLKWRMDRDCDHAYSNPLGRGECHVAAKSWRVGLETPVSTTYFTRSQDWGKRNCRLNAPKAK